MYRLVYSLTKEVISLEIFSQRVQCSLTGWDLVYKTWCQMFLAFLTAVLLLSQ